MTDIINESDTAAQVSSSTARVTKSATVSKLLSRNRGATLSEMPCSIEAARKAKELGMMVCMGAPNYFRGGSANSITSFPAGPL